MEARDLTPGLPSGKTKNQGLPLPWYFDNTKSEQSFRPTQDENFLVHPTSLERQKAEMDNWRTSLPLLIETRRMGVLSPHASWRQLHGHAAGIARLQLETVYKGHIGCVNRIAWNSSGTLLASGSDDTRLLIWKYENPSLSRGTRKAVSKGCLFDYQTGHTANMFGVKFLPQTNDEFVVTGAMDSEVRLHNIRLGQTTVYRCHAGRVKAVDVDPTTPHLFWSASEDGTVRQFDRREAHQCPTENNDTPQTPEDILRARVLSRFGVSRRRSSSHDCENVLVDLRGASRHVEIIGISVNPVYPEYIAIATRDPYIRIFDRRMLTVTNRLKKTDPGHTPCSSILCPPHIHRSTRPGRSSYRPTHPYTTYVTFSPSGRELLASYSSDNIYLFDLFTSSTASQYYIPPTSPRPSSSMTTSTSQPLPFETRIIPPTDRIVRGVSEHRVRILERVEKFSRGDSQILDSFSFPDVPKSATTRSKKLSELTEITYKLHSRFYQLTAREKQLLYQQRATLFLQRKYDGDVDCAFQDCESSLAIDSSDIISHYLQCEAFATLELYEKALECAQKIADLLLPEISARLSTFIENLQGLIALKKKTPKKSKSARRPESSDEDAEDQTEDSEKEQEGDARIEDADEDEAEAEEDEEDENDSSAMAQEKEQHAKDSRECRVEFRGRFLGHRNISTDIKEANFFGDRGQFILSGSDDGRVFIWDRETACLVNCLDADQDTVNCVQGNPRLDVIATSGIESVIRLWSPVDTETSSLLSETASKLIRMNQEQLVRSRTYLYELADNQTAIQCVTS